MIEPTNSLSRTSSWMVREKETGEILFETFNPAVVAKLNTVKYEAVPSLEYLQSLNGMSFPGYPDAGK